MGLSLKPMLVFCADMAVLVSVKLVELKELTVVGANVVLPVMYMLLPPLAEIVMVRVLVLVEEGLRAFKRVSSFESFVAAEYKEE